MWKWQQKHTMQEKEEGGKNVEPKQRHDETTVYRKLGRRPRALSFNVRKVFHFKLLVLAVHIQLLLLLLL